MEILVELILLAAGLFLVVSALYVEARHQRIWKSYKKHYKKPANNLMHELTKPRTEVYQLNVYILWPLTFVVGVFTVVVAVSGLLN